MSSKKTFRAFFFFFSLKSEGPKNWFWQKSDFLCRPYFFIPAAAAATVARAAAAAAAAAAYVNRRWAKVEPGFLPLLKLLFKCGVHLPHETMLSNSTFFNVSIPEHDECASTL